MDLLYIISFKDMFVIRVLRNILKEIVLIYLKSIIVVVFCRLEMNMENIDIEIGFMILVRMVIF